MTDPDFEHLAKVVRQRSGLQLGPEKAYLVRTRLEPVARQAGLASAGELLAKIRREPSTALVLKCVEALATHESSFFRDGAPFEVFRNDVLPGLMQARAAQKTLRIWCAACSSGQEPYSLAMLLQEAGAQALGWRIEIVATDFSRPILEKARAGLYNDFEVRRGLTPERLARWFQRSGAAWKVAPQLAQMITFREHNLLDGPTGLGRFDVVFCRNVLIYFDVERKKAVLDALASVMASDGALFLGSAETILGLSERLESRPGARGVFRLAQPRPPQLARTA